MGVGSFITRYARALLFAVESRGHSVKQICARAEVPYDAVAPDVREINEDVFSRLNVAVKQTLNDDFCGYTRSPCPAGSVPFICEVMVYEETLQDALERACRFYSFITDELTLVLRREQETAILSFVLANPELDTFHYLQEWWMATWLLIASWLIGEEIPIMGVELPHEACADEEDYVELFRGPCSFSRSLALARFPATMLNRRIVRSMSDLRPRLMARQVSLAPTDVQLSWKTLIKTKMKESLNKNERLLSIEDLSQEFHVSSQTVRRRLEEEGITFRTLKNEVRREITLKWLSEPDISIGEISLRAGFAERNGLVRAVRSWVGISPKAYRNQVISARNANGAH